MQKSLVHELQNNMVGFCDMESKNHIMGGELGELLQRNTL